MTTLVMVMVLFPGLGRTQSATSGNTPVEELTTKKMNRCFRLYQMYPNPFNPSTTIRFSLLKSCFITLKIYNLLGKEIETLMNGQRGAGEYKVEWAAEGLPSGIYLYRLEVGEFVERRKLILQR